MVVLVAFLKTTKDRYCRQLVGLVNHHGLETTLQRLVLLKVFLVLVKCGSTDSTQLSTCQSRLQDVGSIHSSLAAAGTYQRVYLVDEEDNTSFATCHLTDDTLQSFLELALVLSTSNECSHIKGVELFLLEVLGDVTTNNSLCQTLDDSCLSRSWLTNEDWVVLGTTRKYLEHTTYLVVPADDGVELSCACVLYKILGVLLQRLVVVVSRLRLHLLSLTQLHDGGTHVFLGASCIFEYSACRRVYGEQRQQQRLYADELVAHLFGDVFCLYEHAVSVAREVRLSSLHTGQVFQLVADEHLYLLGVDAQLLEDKGCNVLCLLQKTSQQVYRLYCLLTVALCSIYCLLNGLLCFDCEFV